MSPFYDAFAISQQTCFSLILKIYPLAYQLIVLKAMQIISNPLELRTLLEPWRRQGEKIAFVPTMGHLHAGHLKLVEEAARVAQHVVVSIFVNPLQFGPHEDYQTYPRTLQTDSEKLRSVGTEILWTPKVEDLYPQTLENCTRVEVPHVSTILCGASRPGHFTGVTTIVNKLLNIVQPHKAFFGEKDYQQLLIIRRMVNELFIPVQINSVPTVREADGLAMSSRNSYLSPQERIIAPYLFEVINSIRERIQSGQQHFIALESQAIFNLAQAGFEPHYVAIRCAETLEIPSSTIKHLVILAAARLGKARLIDNVQLNLESSDHS